MRINSYNLFNVFNRLSDSTKKLGDSIEKVSSGKRINKAADDAANLGISQSMKAQIRGLSQGQRNTQDGISMMQVIDGTLDEVGKYIHRSKELAVMSASGTYTDSERQVIQQEFSEIKDEISAIQNNTEFNGIKLLKEDKGIVIQTKSEPFTIIEISLKEISNASLGLDTASLDTSDNASAALGKLNDALSNLTNYRTEIGAYTNSLQFSKNDASNLELNTTASLSRIEDLDMAKGMMTMVKYDIMENYNESLSAHANGNRSQILSMLSVNN